MIDFACKKFNLNEIIKCGLGITKTEQDLLIYLLKTDWCTAESLSKKNNISLSTVQRSLKNLYEKKLVERRQQNLDRGGYVFVYSSKNKEFIKAELRKILSEWLNKVDASLKNW